MLPLASEGDETRIELDQQSADLGTSWMVGQDVDHAREHAPRAAQRQREGILAADTFCTREAVCLRGLGDIPEQTRPTSSSRER